LQLALYDARYKRLASMARQRSVEAMLTAQRAVLGHLAIQRVEVEPGVDVYRNGFARGRDCCAYDGHGANAVRELGRHVIHCTHRP